MPGAQQLTDPAAYLVAHRGDQEAATENTLAAFQAAVAAGARFLECDIQFTRDLVPVVMHDNWLKRLCGDVAARVIDLDLATLTKTCAPHFSLLTLTALLAWLEKQRGCTLFVEIKPTVRRRLSERQVALRLHDLIAPGLRGRIVVISKSASILDACAFLLACRLGWVASGHHEPESPLTYAFLKRNHAAAVSSWQARGVKVGLYTVNEVQAARRLLAAGADLIETDYYVRMARELGSG